MTSLYRQQGVQASMRDVSPVPASPAQQRMWLIEQLEKGAGRAYHLGFAVRMSGKLEVAVLRRALDAVIERHEVLRTGFAGAQGTALQMVRPPEPFALQVVDLTHGPIGDFAAEIARQAAEERSARFELSVGPLVRGRLLRVGGEEHVLMVTMHHIVSDGWSIGIFIREVAALYTAYLEGRSGPLEPLRIQYGDYARWQKQWLAGEVLAKQGEYWKEQLRGAPGLLELPTDRARPSVRSYRGAAFEFGLGGQLSERLRKLSRQLDVTLYMVLYAGWAIVLSRLSGQPEVVIGAPVANRQSTEAERMIGLFVNTLALRADLRGEPSVVDLLGRIKRMMLAAWSNQEIPFERVVELLQPPRSLSFSPVFQVMFVLQNTPRSELRLAGLTMTPLTMPDSTAQFDLSLSMLETGDEVIGNLNYTTDLFEESTIQRWASYFTNVLAEMARDRLQRVSEAQFLAQTGP